MNNKKLENVNYKINNRLELHGKIKTYNKSKKIVRQNINDFRNKVPMFRRHGIRNDLENSAINAMSESEDSVTQGIMLANKGIGMAKATIRTGVGIVKTPHKVGKTAYRVTKLTIRTGKKLAEKKYALDSPAKDSLFSRQRKNRKLKKKKPGLLSQAKGAGNNLLQVQKEDTSNTGVASIQQALDTRRQIRPYANIAKKATKFSYNIAVKKPVVAIARRNKYNALQSLRTKQRELKYGKSSLNTTSQLGKIKTARTRQRIKMARRSLNLRQAEKKGIRVTTKVSIRTTKAIARILANPLIIKAGVIAAVIFLFVSMFSSIFSALIPTAGTTIMADERVVLRYKERIDKMNEDFKYDIERLKNDSRYDDYNIYHSDEDERMEVSLAEILAISAVIYEQNLEFSEHEQAALNHLFDEMLSYNTSTETYYCPGCVPPINTSEESADDEEDDDDDWTCSGHKRLNIYINYRDMEEVMTEIGFSEDLKDWARLLAATDVAVLYQDYQGS